MNRKLFLLLLILAMIIISVFIVKETGEKKQGEKGSSISQEDKSWSAPDTNSIPKTEQGSMILYGRELIINTSLYFGPEGIIGNAGNGMNCQNCHLEAGTKMFGNNFSKVDNGYPRYKERSGSLESIEKKVEDCFERSMNGNPIDSAGKEMKAIVAYLNWIGSNVPKKAEPPGSGIEELPLMARAADSSNGRIVFVNKCQVCHGKNGEGQLKENKTGYLYPPLWGKVSYNIGASIYRISKLAGFIKNNMPFGTTYLKPQLTDEECWDVAAFINSNFHPYLDTKGDWPNLSKKPFDYPFGPYADTIFSEKEHKYGPFIPIKNYYPNMK